MPEISIFDARLAEIDRRLRNIQTGLAEDLAGPEAPAHGDRRSAVRESPSAAPAASAATPSRAPAVAPTRPLPPRVEVPDPGDSVRASATESPSPAHTADDEAAELLAGLRQLTEIHQHLIESMRGLLSAYEEALGQLGATGPGNASASAPVSVSAGPLANVQALRAFAETLERLPVVRDVEVRGYEGGDRAIVDVHLLDATS